MDSDTQFLGNQEWKNNQIMGGCLAAGTKDGKPGQRDTPTRPHHTRKNQRLSILAAGNGPQQMKNLGQTHNNEIPTTTIKEVEELGGWKITVTKGED